MPPAVLSLYHFSWAFVAAIVFFFPARQLTVIGVTGTKGKTSTSEFVNAIFEAAGHRTAVVNSIRIKMGDNTKPNLRRMSMFGRFALQRLLRRAVDSTCTIAILEMTSEGARQHRHRFVDLDCLIFTNLAPEHIESHGSLEAYADAKFSLSQSLVHSRKRPRIMVANADDALSGRFLALPVDMAAPFSLAQAAPYHADSSGGSFHFQGVGMDVALPGLFSVKNALAAAVAARALGIDTQTIKNGLLRVKEIPGRAQEIRMGQPFTVVVDYAHTPDSLVAIYSAYAGKRLVCVLGNAGGGRDLWKRPEMGRVAETYCAEVILTNEDPYDEDPRSILDMMARGMKHAPTIILDRRLAIREALARAQENDAVIITGKGTDPSIHGPNGKDIRWSDETVVREELASLLGSRRSRL